MTAPLSPAERARLDEFEARPVAEEACAERVARALCEAERWDFCGDDNCCEWESVDDYRRDQYRGLAVAAIDAMRPAPDAPRTEAEAAVERVLALAEAFDADPVLMLSRRAAAHIRAAVTGPVRP